MATYIITTESFPNGMAATQRIRCYAKAISEYEYCQVIVVNRLEDPDNPLGNKNVIGNIGKYTFKYIGNSTAKINNKLQANFVRLFDVLKLLKFLLRKLTKDDKVIFYSYNLNLLRIIAWVTHQKRAKIFYELCEHPSIQCPQCPAIPVDDIRWMKRNLSACDGIIVISASLEDLVHKAFVKSMSVLKVPVLFENPSIVKKIADFNNGIPYIMHTGSLTQKKDGIIHSLTAFGIAISKSRLNIEYIFTGNIDVSPDKVEILDVIAKYGIQDKVKFIGYLSNEELIKYQHNAYMTIINKEDNLQNKYCFATKSCEFLNAECLVITTKIGEVCNYLTNQKDCILFTPGNVTELSEIIIDIFNNRPKRDAFAKAGRELALKSFYCLNYSDSFKNFMK